MRLARLTALSLSAALLAFAPAWAQNQTAQQTAPAPPPAAATAAPRRAMPYRTTSRGGCRVLIGRGSAMMGPGPVMMFRGRFAGRFAGPMGRRMAGFRGGAGFMGFGAIDGLRGPLHGLGARLVRIANNANLRQRLGITDAQAAQIRQQSLNLQISQIHSRADLQVDQLQLRNLLTAENPDSAAIDQKLNQISAAQLAARKQEVTYLLGLRNDLTPEQRQKLQQMRQAPARPGVPAPPRPNG